MRFAIPIIIILIFATVAFAYEGGWGGYSGIVGRMRRLQDPFSRQNYFGENYSSQLINLGSRGPSYRLLNTGSKSAFSSVFNLDTNAFYAQARNPGRISNFDPGMRGYAQVDLVADLLPYDAQALEMFNKDVSPHGTVHVLSRGDRNGAGLNRPYPRSQVFVQVKNLPPLDGSMAYECWLVDEETGYPLSVGLLKANAKLTSELFFEIYRSTAGFEGFMITKEPFPDRDPKPNEVVLFGYLGGNRDVVGELGADVEQRLR